MNLTVRHTTTKGHDSGGEGNLCPNALRVEYTADARLVSGAASVTAHSTHPRPSDIAIWLHNLWDNLQS